MALDCSGLVEILVVTHILPDLARVLGIDELGSGFNKFKAPSALVGLLLHVLHLAWFFKN